MLPPQDTVNLAHLCDGRAVGLVGFVRVTGPLRSTKASPRVDLAAGDPIYVADAWYGPVELEGCAIYVPLSSLAHLGACSTCDPVWDLHAAQGEPSGRVFKLVSVLVDAESGECAAEGPRTQGREPAVKCPRGGLEASREVG